MTKFVVIDLLWVPQLNESLMWDDQYWKIAETISVHDVIGLILSKPIFPIDLEFTSELLDVLLNYFPLSEMDDEKIENLSHYVSDMISILSGALYSDLYYYFNGEIDRLEFHAWIDETSIVLKLHNDQYWSDKENTTGEKCPYLKEL